MFRRNRCRDVTRLLWEYEAGELGAADSGSVEEHLASCPSCRAEAAGYRGAVGAVSAVRESEPPESVRTWSELRSRLESEGSVRERARPAPRRLAPSWAAAAGTVCILALAVHWVLLRQAVPPKSVQGLQPTAIAPHPLPGSVQEIAQNPPQRDRKGIDVKQHGSIVKRTHKAEIHNAFERERVDLGAPRRSRGRHAKPRLDGAQPPTHRERARRDQGAKLYLASLDGAGGSPQPRRDYVLTPAAPAPDSGTQRDYVMGAIPDSGHRIETASYGGGSGEGPVW